MPYPSQSKRVLDLAIMEGYKAELAWLHTEVVYPSTVTHPSTNRAQRRVMRRTKRYTTERQTANCDVLPPYV